MHLVEVVTAALAATAATGSAILDSNITKTHSVPAVRSCPEVDQVYKYINETGSYEVNPPEGWRFYQNFRPGFNYTDSLLTPTFYYAAWDSDRMNPEDENRILCVYHPQNNPYQPFVIETENTVDPSEIRRSEKWKKFPPSEYLRCEESNPSLCTF